MQKHMKLKPEIDHVMQGLYQSGAIDGLYNRWFWNVTNQKCGSPSGVRPLAFDDIGAILVMMPAGILLSLVVLFLEHLSAYCVNSTEIQYQKRVAPETAKPIEHKLWRM
ncbi:uncharacterized protein LOC119110644 [Pollicipes pollicipes]|uniref:uncharacterized protein LOC119110644 n=1 Tax=Pollicipes pollicipes TaxID=41117 RepID=UPI0018853E3A|nr:uncharacterized protein LOC119110644 [Pollicipes pollicipes]